MKKILFGIAALLLASTSFAQVGSPGVSGSGGTPGTPGSSLVQPALQTSVDTIGTVGAELLTNNSFATDLTGWSGANWAWQAGGKARHTVGSTAPLTQSIAVNPLSWYRVTITATGATAGSVSVSIGSVTALSALKDWAETQAVKTAVGDTGTLAVNITPTTDFDGDISDLSVKAYNPTSLPQANATIKNALGVEVGRIMSLNAGPGDIAVGGEVGQVGTGGANTALGYQALSHSDNIAGGGYFNTAAGYQAMSKLVNGVQNTAFGKWALANLTEGSFNVAVGAEAGISVRTGGITAVGWRSLNSVTTGTGTAIGSQAGRGMTTGTSNTCLGANSCWNPGGLSANALTTGIQNTFVGENTGFMNTTQHSNTFAIGYNAVLPDADNVGVIGATTVTDVYFGGNGAAARTRQAIGRTTKYIEGSSAKTLTDAAAAVAVWRCAIPSNDYLGGEIIWSTKSTDTTDYRVTQGRIRFAGVNKAGTNTCTAINVVGTDLTASSNANTLVCTWTNVVNTTNCDLSVTCTDNTAASQTMSVNSRLDMPLPQTCTPQ